MRAAIVINLIGFQLCWFLCVAYGESMVLVVPLLWIALQPVLLNNLLASKNAMNSSRLSGEYLLVLAAVFAGCVIEYGLAYAGVWAEPSTITVPLWLIALWALFAGCIYHSFAWLQGRYLLAAALAAISAPLSYIAGAALNQHYELAAGWFPLVLIGGVWSLIMPSMLYLARRLEREQLLAI